MSFSTINIVSAFLTFSIKREEEKIVKMLTMILTDKDIEQTANPY
jgi:hypothetical protein